MDQYYELGRQLRYLLSGFLETAPPAHAPGTGAGQSLTWGPKIEIAGLQDIYHPQSVEPFSVPSGGIDNLALSSVDKFFVPGRGEFAVNFDGMLRIARDHPTSNDWTTASVFVNLLEMNLTGTHRDLGRITVKQNPAVVSAGQTFGPGGNDASAPAACRIAAGVMFDAPDLGVTMFNKEPILLMNDAIEAIPPVEDANGAAHLYRLPLYDARKPDGKPVAYITSLRYTIGNYLTQAEVMAFRVR